MPHSAAQVPVAVRISSYQIGDRERPRFVWSVGLPVEFLDKLPDEYKRVRLSAKDGVVSVNLNGEGIKLSVPPRGRTAWAGSIGAHHIAGMALPTEHARSIPVEGIFLPAEHRISLTGKLPSILKNAVQSVEELRASAEVERHFPAQHFQEDVMAAQDQHVSEPLQGFKEQSGDALLVLAPAGDHALPVNLAEWSDDNVRRLRELVRDMQANRPDVMIRMTDDKMIFERHQIVEF